MGSRVLVLGLCLAVVCRHDMPTTQACPYCRADAAGLAATVPPPAEDADSFTVMLSGGLDFASAYYFRGYLQADHGPIVQPYLNLFTAHTVNDDLIVRPYLSLFNSTHFASGNPMSDMSDVMAGAVANWNGFIIDSRYAFFTTSPLMRTPVHELGAKISFDVLSPWADSDREDSAWLGQFSLRPFVGVYGDWIEDAGTVQTFVSAGVEPSWRFEVAGTKVGVGLPIDWGLGGNGYYFNNDGSNAALGYFSTALTASVPLPVPNGHGQWFLNTSVQYLHLAADSVQATGNGDNDACIGKIGMSFVY